MYSSDYYTHNESLRSNLFPYIKVFIYENWKATSPTTIDSDFLSNVTSLENPIRKRYSTANNAKRLEVTDFIINVGSINQQGNSDIIQNFTGSSSGTISIVRSISHITDINFDLQLEDPNNIFTILGYDFDGSLADFEIVVGFKTSAISNNVSILGVGDYTGDAYKLAYGHEETIFRGKVSNIAPTETSLQINLVDGMFEAMNTQALIGEQISNERISYLDRFFLDEENDSNSNPISEIYGGWDLSEVKNETEYNFCLLYTSDAADE